MRRSSCRRRRRATPLRSVCQRSLAPSGAGSSAPPWTTPSPYSRPRKVASVSSSSTRTIWTPGRRRAARTRLGAATSSSDSSLDRPGLQRAARRRRTGRPVRTAGRRPRRTRAALRPSSAAAGAARRAAGTDAQRAPGAAGARQPDHAEQHRAGPGHLGPRLASEPCPAAGRASAGRCRPRAAASARGPRAPGSRRAAPARPTAGRRGARCRTAPGSLRRPCPAASTWCSTASGTTTTRWPARLARQPRSTSSRKSGQARVEPAELVPHVATDQHPGRPDGEDVAAPVVLALVELAAVQPGLPAATAADRDADLQQPGRVVPAAHLGTGDPDRRARVDDRQQPAQGLRLGRAVVVQQPQPLDDRAVQVGGRGQVRCAPEGVHRGGDRGTEAGAVRRGQDAGRPELCGQQVAAGVARTRCRRQPRGPARARGAPARRGCRAASGRRCG